MTKHEYIQSTYDFAKKKFGRDGFVKYWLNIPDTKKEQEEIWALIDNKEKCLSYIEGLFDEITKGKKG